VPAPTPLATLTGSGTGLVTLNAAENQITVALNYTGLGSNVIAGHIHGSATATPGNTAPIIFDLAPSGGTSGTNTATTFAITPAQVALLRSGLMYMNVHTVNNPNGEIRGQLHLNDDANNFDADGKVDTAVVRPNSPTAGQRTWFIQRSLDGAINSPQWGLTSDVPVPGDYDSDAKTDVAVFRPSEGRWYVLRSLNNTLQVINWGVSTDVPVPSIYVR
jgi:CHRD domain